MGIESRTQKPRRKNKMTENEIDFKDETFEDDDDALTLDDLSSGYIGNPAVGGSPIEFVVKKVVKLTGTNVLGKDRKGKVFKKNLSNVDYGYEVVTDSGSKYTVAGWEIFGKMKSIFQKLGAIEGTKLRITHLVDGMKSENKDIDKYKVEAEVDGVFKELDRDTKEWSN
jgi:hypothetical protein